MSVAIKVCNSQPLAKFTQFNGTQTLTERELMAKVVKLKLQYFDHVARRSAGQLALTVLEGSMEGTRYQGKPRRQRLNDIEDWTGYKYIQLNKMSVDREQWRKKTWEWSAAVANPRRRKAD